MILLLQLVLALRPDLTPGAAIPRNTAQVCAVPWTADRSTDVPTADWQTVLRRYGLTWEQRTDYLPTLAIPKSLGGVYAVENLWPCPKASEWNQLRKQQVEHKVYDELCAGRLHLNEAQQKASTGWVATWRMYFAQ